MHHSTIRRHLLSHVTPRVHHWNKHSSIQSFSLAHFSQQFSQQQLQQAAVSSTVDTSTTAAKINKRGLIWSKYDEESSNNNNNNDQDSSIYLHNSKINEMIRVDHAGEFGAVTICNGQRMVMNNDPVIEEILSQEIDHFNRFDALISDRRVRPTVMRPIWHVAGTMLGVATAMMGREAAMACHHAVEAVISDHYNEQLREIYDLNEATSEKRREMEFERSMQEGAASSLSSSSSSSGGKTSFNEQETMNYFFSSPAAMANSTAQGSRMENDLLNVIKQFRDDELHHYDLAEKNNAMQAPFYQILYHSIKSGCLAAIWLSKRI